MAFYQYEHLDPPFASARAHDPEAIVLLCAGCHDRVSRGALSKETVKGHAANPKCLQSGFSFGPFDIGAELPELAFGEFRGRIQGPLVEIEGERILAVSPPESPGGPFQIDAHITDADGREILTIDKNCWRTPTENWDVCVEGQRIAIRAKPGEISLILLSEPPNRIIIERLNLFHKGTRVGVSPDGVISVITANGATTEMSGVTVDRCEKGISVINGAIHIAVGGRLMAG